MTSLMISIRASPWWVQRANFATNSAQTRAWVKLSASRILSWMRRALNETWAVQTVHLGQDQQSNEWVGIHSSRWELTPPQQFLSGTWWNSNVATDMPNQQVPSFVSISLRWNLKNSVPTQRGLRPYMRNNSELKKGDIRVQAFIISPGGNTRPDL